MAWLMLTCLLMLMIPIGFFARFVILHVLAVRILGVIPRSDFIVESIRVEHGLVDADLLIDVDDSDRIFRTLCYPSCPGRTYPRSHTTFRFYRRIHTGGAWLG